MASASDSYKTDRKFKQCVLAIYELVKSETTKYCYPKVLDAFYAMPTYYQRSLIEFFAERVEKKVWSDKIEDTTQYGDVMRSILFYYSGREEQAQPTRKEFCELLLEFTKDSASVITRKAFKRSESFAKEVENL